MISAVLSMKAFGDFLIVVGIHSVLSASEPLTSVLSFINTVSSDRGKHDAVQVSLVLASTLPIAVDTAANLFAFIPSFASIFPRSRQKGVRW